MDENAEALRALMVENGLSREATAPLLHVSPHTVAAWLKPRGCKSSNPTPMWAVELLAYKTGSLPIRRRTPAGPGRRHLPQTVVVG